MDAAYLDARITRTKATIELYEDAIDALVLKGVQSYTFDTGLNRTTVTKADLPGLQTKLDSLYNRLVNFQNRRNGGGAFNGRPDW